MFCSACGTKNSPESAYCSNCGVKIAPPVGAAPPAGRQSSRANLVAGIVVLALLLAAGAGYAWKRFSRGAGGDEASIKVTVDGKSFELSSRDARVEAGGPADELSANMVRGRVVDTGWRKYVVQSSDTGKTYIFHVGRQTSYNTRRKPGVGSSVRMTYRWQRGRLVADRVEIE